MLIPFQQHDAVEQDASVVEPTPDKKIKILFYHAGIHDWFYPAVLQFKTYIDLYFSDTAKHIEWLIPIQNQKTDQELIDHIRTSGADLFCTSHYIWNHDFLTKQLERIVPEIKNQVKIMSGGPSINVNDDPAFFDKYSYVDYAVFAAGEQAIADILTHLVFKNPLIAFNTSNCAWRHPRTNKVVVAEYKFVKMIETSPFVYNEQLFTEMTKDFFETNKAMWFPYTLTRGCPYSCTFCDWNSGLGNKVSRRKNTYQQEIDLFQKLGIKNIYLSDANVGQYQEDVDMIEYFVKKNLDEKAEFHVGGNFSKLKKENNLKIFHAMARGRLVKKTFNISIQDTNQEILNNIDRPDVGWEVHAAMADELRQTYPHLYVKAQLIYGLPGQTVKSWTHTLGEVTDKSIFPIIFFNEPLPSSPAVYDPEYQRKFQYEYIQSNRILANKQYLSLIAKRSSSFDQSDLVHMNIVSGMYQAVTAIKLVMAENNLHGLNVREVATQLIQSEKYQNLYNNLYNNWTVDNNFFFTINFNNEPEIVPDLILGYRLARDFNFAIYVKNFLPKEMQKNFAKLVMSNAFENSMQQVTTDFD